MPPPVCWPDATIEMSIGELLRLFAPQGQPYVSPGQRPGIPSLLSPTSPERAILNDDSRTGPPFQGYVEVIPHVPRALPWADIEPARWA
jgi:hypothetical protein